MRDKALDKPFYFKAPFNCVKLTLSFPVFPFDPLKTSENQRFSDVFRGDQKGTLISKGLRDRHQISLLMSNEFKQTN